MTTVGDYYLGKCDSATVINMNPLLIFCVYVALLTLTGCLNPFAPVEGEVGLKTWDDQTSVAGLLNNFELSYQYRDSLRYADCLGPNFVFHYYDVENGRYDRWFRETDLKATAGLFRNFDNIDLKWNMVPDTVSNFNLPHVTLGFIARFTLTLDGEVPILGYARFEVRAGDDNRFRVSLWRDDF